MLERLKLSKPWENQTPLTDTVALMIALATRLSGYRITASGEDDIPLRGRIDAITHHDHFDVPAHGTREIWKRNQQVYYLTKQELISNRLYGRVLKRIGGLALNRESPTKEQLEAAISTASSGHPVGIFAEGKLIPQGYRVRELKGGVALLARRAEVPVQAVGIAGDQNAHWSKPRPVHIHYGKIFEPPARHQTERFNYELRDEMQKALNIAQLQRYGTLALSDPEEDTKLR